MFQIDETELEVFEGEGIFINSNFLHSAHSLHGAGCSFFAVVFHPSFLCNYTNDQIKQKYVTPILNHTLIFPTHFKTTMDWQNDILVLLKDLLIIQERACVGFELLMKSKIFEIWNLAIQNAVTGSKYSMKLNYKTERLKNILNYINEHYSNKLTLTELARINYMSEEHFCRFFKELTHDTPISYINKFRIQKSCSLLSQTDKKISEIASLVGFENISYYNKIFLEVMKCTPSQYRLLVLS